jgi:hypothetical protein
VVPRVGLRDSSSACWWSRPASLARDLSTESADGVDRCGDEARAAAGLSVREAATLLARHRTLDPRTDGDPRTDTSAAAAHIVGLPWATGSQGITVKKLRAAAGMTRERLESAYEHLLEHPPLGLAVQWQRDELFLVSALEVSRPIERHLGHPRPLPLTRAASEVLAMVAYKQPITRAAVPRSSISAAPAATARSTRCSSAAWPRSTSTICS